MPKPLKTLRRERAARTASAVAQEQMTETVLLNSIRAAARNWGWLVYRAQFSMYSTRGWPDLFCVRGGRAFAWELKSAKGKLSEAQTDWIEALKAVPGVDARVVYPSDLEAAYQALVTGTWPG